MAVKVLKLVRKKQIGNNRLHQQGVEMGAVLSKPHPIFTVWVINTRP